MVLVGSKKKLDKVSSTFRDVWITFIREFNHAFPRRASADTIRQKIGVLKGEVILLQNEVSRRTDETSHQKELDQYHRNLVALRTNFNELLSQLTTFESLLPIGEVVIPLSQHRDQVAALQIKIRTVKTSIALVSDSYVSPSRRKFLGKVTAAAVIALLASGAGFSLPLNSYLTKLATSLPRKREGLAILISYQTTGILDTAVKPFLKLYLPGYVARIELAFGQKADVVVKGATRNDFFDVLENDAVQNIVLFGHGGWNSWMATDETVWSHELAGLFRITNFNDRRLRLKKQRKTGLLVRHTCGVGREVIPEEIAFLIKPEDWRMVEEMAERVNAVLSPDYSLVIKLVKPSLEELPANVYRVITFGLRDQRRTERSTSGFTFKEPAALTDPSFYPSFWHWREYFKGYYPAADSSLQEFLVFLRRFLEQRKISIPKENNVLLGVPIYPPSRIKGWDRLAFPWEFMVNVFGSKDKQLDQLYQMK